MLNRTIRDIFHLKRLHAIVPDHSLGLILKDKLCRLNLKPALQYLKKRAEQLPPLAHQQEYWNHLSDAPDPSALCQLLECLAYFELGKEKITQDALELVQSCLPNMNSLYLSKTLAASCALGQQDTSSGTIALLAAALGNGSEQNSFMLHPTSSHTASALSVNLARSSFGESSRGVVHTGSDIILLMESLQKSDVHQEEVWSLLAEHCVRILDSFDGKELFRIIELFYLEGLTYYPDFFVAAERHIARQPASFMPAELLQKMITYYKDLGQPVVCLLSLSSSRYADGFNTGLTIAAAKVRAGGKSNSENGHSAKTRIGISTHARPSSHNPLEERASDYSHIPDSFVEIACRTFSEVGGQELLELIQRCETKCVIHPDIVKAAVDRLHELYFSRELAQDDVFPPNTSSSESKGTLLAVTLGTPEFHCVSQCIHTLLEFQDPHLFQRNTANRLSAMLNSLAQTPFPATCRNRLLTIAHHTLCHLPNGTERPSTFYKALVEHIAQAKDIATSESPERLRLLTSVLVMLGSYGGHHVLNQYLPVLSVAVANTPRSTQIELAALLSAIPSTHTELLPNLFHLITSDKKWSYQLSVAEVRGLLKAMRRTQTRSSHLVTGIVRFIQSHRNVIEPQELADFMRGLVLLGFRDIDFFSSTIEHLLNAVSPVTRRRASVHDLCEVLYTLTFVLRGVIRVVQQVLARLKVSASQVTPRDITLTLYSFVKLRVARHQDISAPFCDRAVAILPSFKAEELVSMLSSLRTLNFNHRELIRASYDILLAEMQIRQTTVETRSCSNGATLSESDCLPVPPHGWRHRLQDDQFMSMVAAVVHLAHTNTDLGPEDLAKSQGNQKPSAVVAQAPTTVYPLCDVNLRDLFVEISMRVLSDSLTKATPSNSSVHGLHPNPLIGLQLYLTITSLAMFDPQPSLSAGQWAMLAVLADANTSELHKGYATSQGRAAAEVLAALYKLRRTVLPDPPGLNESLRRWVELRNSWSKAIPPKLCGYVRANSGVVFADNKLKESLKNEGVLRDISLAGGAGEIEPEFGGNQLSNSGTRRSRSKGSGKSAESQNLRAVADQKVSFGRRRGENVTSLKEGRTLSGPGSQSLDLDLGEPSDRVISPAHDAPGAAVPRQNFPNSSCKGELRRGKGIRGPRSTSKKNLARSEIKMIPVSSHTSEYLL